MCNDSKYPQPPTTLVLLRGLWRLAQPRIDKQKGPQLQEEQLTAHGILMVLNFFSRHAHDEDPPQSRRLAKSKNVNSRKTTTKGLIGFMAHQKFGNIRGASTMKTPTFHSTHEKSTNRKAALNLLGMLANPILRVTKKQNNVRRPTKIYSFGANSSRRTNFDPEGLHQHGIETETCV